MTDDELTPLRLDAIMDGEAAVSDEEREMLALAAQLRADVPHPSPALRTRITAIGDQPARRSPRRWRGWSSAPALGALVVVLIGGGIAMNTMQSNPTGGSNDMQAGSERSAPADSGTSAQGDSQSAGPAASSSKGLSGSPDIEREQSRPPVSAWTLPSIAIEGAVADLRVLVRDRQLAIMASSSADTTTLELELPVDGTRSAFVAAVTEVLAAHDGVANTGPIALAPDQAALTITLTDAK